MRIDWDRLRANRVESSGTLDESTQFGCIGHGCLGQQFGRQERLWGNGIFSIFLIGYSGNNEIGEAEVGSMLTLPSIMSRTSQETSAIFQRGQQVTLLVRDWRISIHLQHLLVSAFG